MRSIEELLRRWKSLSKEMKSYNSNKIHLIIDQAVIDDTITYLKNIPQDKFNERKC